MKLTHKLWNTNDQHRKYYGHSGDCPSCGKYTECLDHVYQCRHKSAKATRETALASLKSSLTKHLPQVMLDWIVKGVEMRTTTQTDQPVHTDIHDNPSIKEAVEEQTDLGWSSVLQGHISLKWHLAFWKTFHSRKLINQSRLHKKGKTALQHLILGIWNVLFWYYLYSTLLINIPGHYYKHNVTNAKGTNDPQSDDCFKVPKHHWKIFIQVH